MRRPTDVANNEALISGTKRHETLSGHQGATSPRKRSMGRHARILLVLIVVALPVASLGEAPGTWNPWSTVSEGRAAPGSPVTAISYGQRIALFITDPKGGVYTTAGTPESNWGPWASVSEGRAAPGSPVTAVPYKGGLALFLADPNGGIYAATGNPDAGWGPWKSVSQGQAKPGSLVTAVLYKQRITLFLTDPNGEIFTTSGTPDSGWGAWASVSEGRAKPGSPVAAIPYGQSIVIFVTDPNGGIFTTSGTADSGWGAWTTVSEGRTIPGSPVMAILYAKQHIALFLTDPNGGIYTSVGGPPKPMDVIAWKDGKDDNGFLRNPVWRRMAETGQPPNSCSLCPCGKNDTPLTWNFAANCTSQTLHQNSSWWCSKAPVEVGEHTPLVGASGSGIPYHMNWFPVEYEGTLWWDEHSSVGKDDDYNFLISGLHDHALETAPLRREPGVEIEFDSDETVDHWDDTNTWWDAFHHHFVDTNDPATAALIKDKFAIVIGLVGLDVSHLDHHSELHPVYAMFVKLPVSSTEDKWAFFVRNWGNEGYCGPDDEPIPQKTIQIRIPQHPAATTFVMNDNIWTLSDDDDNKEQCRQQQEWSIERTADGALLTFSLMDASKKCGFVGDLTIDWGSPDAPQPPPPAGPAVPTAHGHRGDEDPDLDSKIQKLNANDRQLLFKQLRDQRRHPTALRKKRADHPLSGGERSGPAVTWPSEGKTLKSVPNPTQVEKKDARRIFILTFLKAHGIQ